MRLAFLVSEDYDFMYDMFHNLFLLLQEEHTLVGFIALPNKLAQHRGIKIFSAYLQIFGLKTFLWLSMRTILKRLKIILGFFFKHYPAYSYKQLCKYYNIPRLKYTDPNHPDVVEWVNNQDIDMLIIFSGFILKQPLIEAVNYCILNKHAGLLPAYRGVFPVFWALKNHDPVGVTIHKVNENIDDGEIIIQKRYPAQKDYTVYDYYRVIYRDTPNLIIKSLNLLKDKKREPFVHQLPESYYSLPTKAEFKAFTRAGFRFA